MTLEEMIIQARAQRASDLILVAGKAPSVYVHGDLRTLAPDALTPAAIEELLGPHLTDDHRKQLDDVGDADFALGGPAIGRARVNVHKQRGTLATAIRLLSAAIPSFEELNLPPLLGELSQLPRGLVLVTGNTGSGKSTTLAAMIEYMNDRIARHVITLEDPIEFVFSHRRCVIEQREIGFDSPSFAHALRTVVRQKPDVILVGEMRDRETIATALTAAETGHVVLATLHTNSAAQTIERVIDAFEPGHQAQIRIQLANTLQAVICQSLLPRHDRPGMVPALEIMLMTPAIRRAIRDSDTHLIPGMIETGSRWGMCTLDQSLADLVNAGLISDEHAMGRAADPERLQRMMGRIPAASNQPTPEPVGAAHSDTEDQVADPWG